MFVPPFQGLSNVLHTLPRSLPWAGMWLPLRGEKSMHNFKTRQRGTCSVPSLARRASVNGALLNRGQDRSRRFGSGGNQVFDRHGVYLGGQYRHSRRDRIERRPLVARSLSAAARP